jgi:hypothetical protein
MVSDMGVNGARESMLLGAISCSVHVRDDQFHLMNEISRGSHLQSNQSRRV